jgi:ABC-2 type transport system permease protein
MSAGDIALPRLRRAAFSKIVLNEARLAWRQPAGLIAGIGLPVLLLVIFGVIPSFRQDSSKLGGYSAFDIYIPILISLVIGMLAMIYLPGPLVAYREHGILRRLSTTPARPSWVLAAQLVVQGCLMVTGVLILIVVSVAAFGAAAPRNPGGLVLSLALGIAAMFALGLAIAAVAKTGGAARAIMAAVLYPLMFFAGLYVPLELLPSAVQTIGDYSPLGAVVDTVGSSWTGQFPPAGPLLALAGYAVVLGFVAQRFFRWE